MTNEFGRNVRRWVVGAMLVALLVVAAAMVATSPSVAADGSTAPAAAPASGGSTEAANFARGLSKAFREAADRALPAVVSITTRPAVEERETASDDDSDDEDGDDPFGELFKRDPNLRRFFGDMPGPRGKLHAPRRQTIGLGSGVIIDASGVILTNNHVVDGGGKITVRLMDGREFPAAEVKADPRTDLAIVRIKNAGSLKVARFGDSDKLAVGDWVLALGDPFGLEGTVTAGIISAKGRDVGIRPRENFLQTDASINPGNSGGPLVNLDGEIVGINTAISSDTGVNAGIGFAVPVNLAKWVAEQLMKTGRVQRAYLGIGIQPITQDLAEGFGVKVRGGVVVGSVGEKSPAEKAGLKDGDVVVKFDGRAVASPSELQGLVEQAKIGQDYPLEVIRDGKHLTLRVAPLEQPANYGMKRMERQGMPNRGESARFEKLGIEVVPLTEETAEQLGLQTKTGVIVSRVLRNSPADQAGLESGMVITKANHKPVKTVEELKKAVESQPLEKGVLLQVRTNEGSRFMMIRVLGK